MTNQSQRVVLREHRWAVKDADHPTVAVDTQRETAECARWRGLMYSSTRATETSVSAPTMATTATRGRGNP